LCRIECRENKGYNDSNQSGSNSKIVLRELMESPIQHYKFAEIEKRYYTEKEIDRKNKIK